MGIEKLITVTEKEFRKNERTEKQIQMKLIQKQEEEAAKKKQVEEAERLKSLVVFTGRKDNYRSQKKRFKHSEKKVDPLDPELQDLKEYLDPAIFQVIKENKDKVEQE